MPSRLGQLYHRERRFLHLKASTSPGTYLLTAIVPALGLVASRGRRQLTMCQVSHATRWRCCGPQVAHTLSAASHGWTGSDWGTDNGWSAGWLADRRAHVSPGERLCKMTATKRSLHSFGSSIMIAWLSRVCRGGIAAPGGERDTQRQNNRIRKKCETDTFAASYADSTSYTQSWPLSTRVIQPFTLSLKMPIRQTHQKASKRRAKLDDINNWMSNLNTFLFISLLFFVCFFKN